jgi:hypothetical protein
MLARSFALLLLLAASVTYGETTIGPLEPTSGTWRVYRGTTYVCSGSSEEAAKACAVANAESRRLTTRYQIRYPNRYLTVTYTAPTCDPKPDDLWQTAQCPAGTTGSYPQVKTHITAAYPGCWTQSEWTPTTPPEGACTPIPPPDADGDAVPDAQDRCPSQPAATPDGCPVPLTPPSSFTATASGTSIAIVWSEVPGAGAYQVQRCTNAGCTNWAQLWCEPAPSTGRSNTNLPAGTTYRYRARVNRAADCSSPDWSLYSAIVTATTEAANRAPTIGGTPATSVQVGQAYAFQPTAADADSNALTFSIANRPAWGAFSTSTGRLTGTPAAANVGTYSGVAISVTDGQASASLAPFSIAVTQSAAGTATLSWVAPTQNTDGSALTNLAGYTIHYGESAAMLHRSVQVASPSTTSYIIDGLTPGAWDFAVRAYTSNGAESALSNIASKVVQ